jgi:histidinol phosphatase-like enzyme
LTPGAAKAIHLLNSHHILFIVVTNQAGIARGYFTIAQMHLDLTKSYLVGDKLTDIQAGNRAGCQTILVETGYGKAESTNCQSEIKPDRISPDLLYFKRS